MRIRKGDALVLVDVQRDFLPGGSLAVPGGERVIEPLRELAGKFRRMGAPVFATRDWHPADHSSFRERGGKWPVHCVMGTAGAEFPPQLQWSDPERIISKASTPERDAYSGFDGTDLEARLRADGICRVFVGGLAAEYCVLNTVLDARKLGYDVIVIEDAIRGLRPEDEFRARQEMSWRGAEWINSGEVEPDAVSELRNRAGI